MIGKYMKKLWVAALLCGICPLAVGITIFIVFYFTQAKWLMLPGIYTMYAGFALSVTGLICLTVYTVQLFKSSRLKEGWRKIVGGYLLLLSVAPMAIVLLFASYGLAQMSTVKIHNKSPVSAIFYWQGPAGKKDSVWIFPGRSKRVLINDEGTINFEISAGTSAISGVLFDIPSGLPLSAIISIDENQFISVQQLTHEPGIDVHGEVSGVTQGKE